MFRYDHAILLEQWVMNEINLPGNNNSLLLKWVQRHSETGENH